MTTPAHRVVVFGTDAEPINNLISKLEARGYRCLKAASLGELLEQAASECPDLSIVHVAPGASANTELLDVIKQLTAKPEAPLLIIGEGAEIETAIRDSRRDIVDILPHDFHDMELNSHVHALVRLKNMQDELARRRESAELYGIKDVEIVIPPADVDDAALVILGPDPAERDRIGKIVGEARIRLSTDNRFEAEDHLIKEFDDGLIVIADGDDRDALEVCTDIRKNPRLYNLPLVFVCAGGGFADSDEPYRCGANEVFIEPLDHGEFGARLDALVAQQRYRLGMRRMFRRFYRPIIADGLTDVYSYGFLHTHLASEVANATAWTKPLTVGMYQVEGVAEVNEAQGYVGGDRLLRQIGGMITGLIRGEDLCARTAGNEFVVVLPGTTPDEAKIALNRIAAVISNTEISVADMVEPVSIYLRAGSAGVEAGDTSKSLLRRARESMT